MAERRGLTQTTNFPRVTGGFRELAAVAVVDPDFASVVLLLDFDGADAGTNITDLSNSGHVDTCAGDAQIDTALPFLGKNSLLLDGTGDWITVPDSDDWDFGTADFTIELGFRPTVADRVEGLITTWDAGSVGWFLQYRADTNSLVFRHGSFGIVSITVALGLDTFHHIAVARSGTDFRVFIDGVQIGSTVTDSTDFTGGLAVLTLGVLRVSTSQQPLNGSIGAVRITKGVARYTENFTPLTVFYPTS